MDLLQAAVLAAAGLAAGFINTLAGGGSVITLPVLEWAIGCPVAANATNRIGLLFQNLMAVRTFHAGGRVPYRLALRLSVPAAVGGVFGAWLATELDPTAMRAALAAAVVFVALVTVFKTPKAPRLKSPWIELAFLVIGVYMGFLQAGAGFALLACLVGGLGLDLVRANAAKVFVVLITTVFALLIFGLKGQVHLLQGLVLALGTTSGAWIAANLAIRKGAAWIRVVIVLAAIGAVTKLLAFPSA
ncbi:MAG: sulfite exporter TauE/SafE family protein [Planctomycetota bacterium]